MLGHVVEKSSLEECVGRPLKKQRFGVCVGSLLLIHACLLAWCGWSRSPVYDEPAHLSAGLSHWMHGRFDLFRANPPLTRMVGSIPLLMAGVEDDWLLYFDRPGGRPEFQAGRALLAAHGDESFWLFTLARWACIPTSLIGGLFCYAWGRAIYGVNAGLVALSLWCFSPNVLTHGVHVTPDNAAAAMGVMAGFFFWRWLRIPTHQSAFVAGVALGLAELTKMTWLVLFAVWPAAWLVDRVMRQQRPRVKELLQVTLILGLGLFMLNLAYAFQGTGRALGEYEFVSETLAGSDAERDSLSGNRFRDVWLGRIPVPLPADYVLGIDIVKEAFEMNRIAYLRGEFSNGGWWYYYLYALVVKVPIGTWILVALSTWVGIRQRTENRSSATLVLLAVPVLLVVLASVNSGINRHLRYLLPAFPFMFIYAGRWARTFCENGKAVATIGSIALAMSVASSLWVYPHSTAYFNELAGGPAAGHRHLISSNIDWGQDLLNLRRWLRTHPGVQEFTLAYYGPTDPARAGIRFEALPPYFDERAAPFRRGPGPSPGWHIVSVHLLRGSPATVYNANGKRVKLGFGWYRYFLKAKPAAVIGHSIHVYYLSEEDTNEIRRALSLRPVPN